MVSVNGSGDVQVAGQVSYDDRGTEPVPALVAGAEYQGGREGVLPGDVPEALARMYSTTTHVIMIPLPKAGDGEVALALEDQPWTVRVSP